MLKKMMNHAVVDFTISPIDPMLIKSGQATVSGVDMSFVRTYRHGSPEPFIPGSSLKGVIRSYAEKICRSLKDTPVPVCLPYLDPYKPNTVVHNGEKNQAACGARMKHFIGLNKKKNLDDLTIPTPDVYKISCPACKMFGSHYFIGRVSTSDGYLTEEYSDGKFIKSGKHLLENRDGVAIDRLTGGTAAGAKYDLEVLTKGDFGTRIEIHNFERWQLGLIGLVMRDMCDGLIRIGMAKSRGLGRIEAKINRFEVSYFGKKQRDFVGLAALCSAEEVDLYGMFPETPQNIPLPEPHLKGLKYVYDLTESWQTTLEPAVNDLAVYIEHVPWPREIAEYTERRL